MGCCWGKMDDQYVSLREELSNSEDNDEIILDSYLESVIDSDNEMIYESVNDVNENRFFNTLKNYNLYVI